VDTNIKGTITELKCITYFLERGYTVSIPQNPTRYDFILDTGDELLKVQVKTCNTTRKEGAINFCTASSHYVSGKHTHTNYKSDKIDYFCTYYDNQCYLIPIEDCGSREKSLFLTTPKNGQVKGICFASSYEADKTLELRSRLKEI
jgi:hypothetical protein